MSKLTSLAVGLLTAISIVPAAQAMAASSNTSVTSRPAADLHAQVIVKIGTPVYREPEYHRDWEARRRHIEWEREREARARWEAERRHHRYEREHREYHGDYRHDHYHRY